MFGTQRARVAGLAARVEQDRAAWHAARRSLRASTLHTIGSPAGLTAAFLGGLLVGPTVRTLGRGLRGLNNFGLTLATFGLSPRDLMAGVRAVRRFMAAPPDSPPDSAG
jgi:hypothetical protein